MAVHEQTCYSCWGTFTAAHAYITTCPTCRQTQNLIRHRDQQAHQQAQQQREDALRQMERAAHEQRRQEYYTNMLVRAENERVDAINHQTKVLEETSLVSAKDAYQEGFSYIKNNWYSGKNYAKMSFYVNEEGTLISVYEPVYVSEILSKKFGKGLGDSMVSLNKDTNEIREYMEQQAYLAGLQNAKGTLSNKFRLGTSLFVNGAEIFSRNFDSKLEDDIDLDTGKITYIWTPPFQSKSLNEQFAKGVHEAEIEMNTPELMQKRLKEEVPPLRKEQQRIARIRFYNKLFPTVGIIVLAYLFFLSVTEFHGWAMIFSFSFVVFLGSMMKSFYEGWQYKNYEYL